MVNKYIVTRTTERVQKDMVVYDFIGNDYGLSATDSKMMGEEYASYSFSKDGSAPFVTIPKSAVKIVY